MSLASPPPAPPTAPSAPPAPPASQPSGSPRDSRVWWLVGGAAVIVGLIVAGGSLFSRVDREGTSFKYGWPFVLIGLAIGVAVGAMIVMTARRIGFRSTTTETVAIVVLSAALGALLGLALAPPKVEAADVSPLTEEEQQRREEAYGDLPEGTKAGPIDRDGDGKPDLDENGRPIVGLDTDGDGIYDTVLEWCPSDSPPPKLPPEGEDGITVSFNVRGFTQTAPSDEKQWIDNQCDGTVDEVIEYDDQLLLPPEGQTESNPIDPRTPGTIAPDARQDRADEASAPSTGRIMRAVLIGLGILLAVAGIGWMLARMQRTSENQADSAEADAEVDSFPPPAPPNQNFTRSMNDLIDDPDPRNGILAAYGHLLAGFDEIGLGRQPHEGPQEHLDRALAASSADPAAATALTTAFATARFSDHPITEDDRRRAIQALRQVTNSIESRTTAPAISGTTS